MEAIFFIFCSSCFGYIIHNQEKLKEEVSSLCRKVDIMEVRLSKRKTDNDS